MKLVSLYHKSLYVKLHHEVWQQKPNACTAKKFPYSLPSTEIYLVQRKARPAKQNYMWVTGHMMRDDLVLVGSLLNLLSKQNCSEIFAPVGNFSA